MSCWCRGFLLLILVCLPCSSLHSSGAWFDSGDYGIGGTALDVHLFLLFLVCLPLWSCCRWTARVWLKKGYICFSLALSGRQLSLAPFWWLPRLVCAVVHAQSLVCCLGVCVCKCCALGLEKDQLGWSLCISSLFHFFANLPSGYATWHNTCFITFVFVCRDQDLIKMIQKIFKSKIKWRCSCST